MVKNLPVMQKTRVGSLGQEDPLEKGMATHSNILAWRIPQTEELGMLLPMGSQSQTQPSDLHVHFTIPEPIWVHVIREYGGSVGTQRMGSQQRLGWVYEDRWVDWGSYLKKQCLEGTGSNIIDVQVNRPQEILPLSKNLSFKSGIFNFPHNTVWY